MLALHLLQKQKRVLNCLVCKPEFCKSQAKAVESHNILVTEQTPAALWQLCLQVFGETVFLILTQMELGNRIPQTEWVVWGWDKNSSSSN